MLVKSSVMELLHYQKDTYYVFLQCFIHICFCACKKRFEKFKKLHRQKLLCPTENTAPGTPRP